MNSAQVFRSPFLQSRYNAKCRQYFKQYFAEWLPKFEADERTRPNAEECARDEAALRAHLDAVEEVNLECREAKAEKKLARSFNR